METQVAKLLFYYVEIVEIDIPGYTKLINGDLDQNTTPEEYIIQIMKSPPIQEYNYQSHKHNQNTSVPKPLKINKNDTDDELKEKASLLWENIKKNQTKKLSDAYTAIGVGLTGFLTGTGLNAALNPFRDDPANSLLQGSIIGILTAAGTYLILKGNRYLKPTNVSNFQMFRFNYFINSKGKKILKRTILTKKIIGLYFGALYCGPCRRFVPSLVDYFNYMKKHNPNLLEIIYMSWDKSESDYKTAMNGKPWVAVPFNHSGKINPESYYFQVKTIPTLIFIDTTTGDILTFDGRNEILTNPYLYANYT